MGTTRTRGTIAWAIAALLAAGPAPAQGPAGDFAPHYAFQGSQLTGWSPLGSAQWSAENGELVGRAAPGGPGGWLVLEDSLQDVAFFTRFRCSAPCDAGVLLRAERTPQGTSGIFVSLAEGDLVPYRVTLDANGRETSRERLGRAAGARTGDEPSPLPPRAPDAPPPPPPGSNFGPPEGVTLPELQLPPRGIQSGEWNTLDVILDANILRPNLNGGNEIPNAYVDPAGYGAIALYTGGSEVRFADVAYRDIHLHDVPAEHVSSRFRMQKLDDFSRAWDAAAGDFNGDGILDVVAGAYYYLGPDYTQFREIYLGVTQSPGMDYVANMITHVYDFNGDGWDDVLSGSYSTRPIAVYINPKGENRRWDRHAILPGLSSEITLMEDVVGDEQPELLFRLDGVLNYATFRQADPAPEWTVHPVSASGLAYGHSLGVGDVDGDGLKDILQTAGWWKQPAPGSGNAWAYHPQAFSRWSRSQVAGGGNMAVWDVNGDGLNDVVTSLNAHGWGLAWFEQQRDASGAIAFERHMIMDDYSTANAGGVTFSELHSGVIPADIDGDGAMDFVTGKRFWSHLDGYSDADAQGPAVLYWYRAVRNASAPGGVEFVPELIHNRSGVGSLFKVVDVNRDGAMDILTSATRGSFIFWGTPAR